MILDSPVDRFLPPGKAMMNAEYSASIDVHQLGETATHPIARFSSRLTALLLVAGGSPAPRRALPADSKTAHSDASN
jgi:hypothetical protein